MSDRDIGKRMVEREDLKLFLEAYELATGEVLSEMEGSETPDFIGPDEQGRLVGIEVTRFRFEQDERFRRRISVPEPGDLGAWLWLLERIHKKQKTLTQGRWPECDRKILVIMMEGLSIADLSQGGIETDRPQPGNFDEVWLADGTQVDAFGAIDLFAVVHPTLGGHFATGDRGQKPFG
jgi:hypothetical protein